MPDVAFCLSDLDAGSRPFAGAIQAQESFALTIPLAILLTSSADQLRSTMSPAKALLLSMFSIHYLNR